MVLTVWLWIPPLLGGALFMQALLLACVVLACVAVTPATVLAEVRFQALQEA